MVASRELAILRFNETSEIPLGCMACPLRVQCGGDQRARARWSCMDLCAGCKGTCTTVCLSKPDQFALDYEEVGGFGLSDIPRFTHEGSSLPHYLPLIKHKYINGVLDIPWAAISLGTLMRLRAQHYAPIADTPDGLRAAFGLAPSTNILLVGVDTDDVLERFWAYHTVDQVAEALAELGLSWATAPNFSFALDEPRPTHLHSRRRSLLCAAEWSNAGINTIPFVHALTRTDWEVLEEFLRDHPEVRYVCAEFQTGLRPEHRARPMLNAFTTLRENLGRDLHLIAVGGGHHRQLFSERRIPFSIVDSTPFLKSVKRRRFHPERSSNRWERVEDANVAELLMHNIGAWRSALFPTMEAR